jgi:acid phosphatase class B
MVVGIDYWQVISHYPDYFKQLTHDAWRQGNDYHIISAVGKPRAGTVEAEVRKLGFSDLIPVHEVIFDSPKQSPELKLAKCQELGIEVFYDDRDDVCRLLTTNGILAMRVTRKDSSTYDLESERK